MGRLPGPVKPSVKAAYTSEPKSPVSQKLSPPSFTTTGIFVMDLDTGIVLLDKNPHLRLKPASLTKIMTSLVALDYYSEGSVLKVINGQKSLGNTVKLVKGDELTASEVIYALLVPSGNDAAVTLAENYPGGYQQFVKKMNQKITELGLSNTNFTNVSGVESPNHYTSASWNLPIFFWENRALWALKPAGLLKPASASLSWSRRTITLFSLAY
ncbi:MAG: D-Ala-D-Ala carboxypeptidase [Candidatus Collierbacteria bacterium GW2011_GWA2_44_99]|uniref:D-Ala-D-Ala carboxypeptidase n=1 Tax=Candidatus Collierbacteria bacterium GW2011_GWA2_44_99 TaxID=1618380 RepID=A0A0G1KN71_9BACT|nr:MAG: D-Ala-D-Ala carboxypeptidase [Candidatus Collierbacteria bacterium GW2011_GWA2_44_99]